jgi:2-epi-5-epi-valiolone 7-phosphate 2-epimerase
MNDVGLALDCGRANPTALSTLKRALDCAYLLDIRVLHIPGFRRSAARTDALRAGTAEILRQMCELGAKAGITIAYESPLGASATLALAEAVQDPSLRIVLDTGNLLGAGEDPIGFADALGGKDLLLPDLHIKDSARAVNASQISHFELLHALLNRVVVRSVLVENDYGDNPERLCSDITHARRTVARACGVGVSNV